MLFYVVMDMQITEHLGSRSRNCRNVLSRLTVVKDILATVISRTVDLFDMEFEVPRW